MAICTLDDVKSWLGIPDGNTDYDDVLNTILASVEQSIYNYTDSKFELTPILNEPVDGNRSDTVVPRYWPIVSIQEIRFGTGTDGTGGTPLEPEDYVLREDAVTLRWLKTPRWRGSMGIDYTYGYDGVPADIHLACILGTEAIYRRKERKTIGMASRSKGDESETIKGDYTAWDQLTGLPKEIVAMMKPYKSFEFPTQPMATRNE